MVQKSFTYKGFDCVVTYDGGLPNYLVDGDPLPCGVVWFEDDFEHIGEPLEFWVEALKEYLDGLA